MSNKRIYKKRQKLSTSPKSPSTLKPRYNENDWSQAELILDQLLECNTVCKNGFTLVKHKNEFEAIEWMINNLPTLPYVIDNYLNFMFTNKLTTGDEELDNNVLNPFLYKRNAKGVTNIPFLGIPFEICSCMERVVFDGWMKKTELFQYQPNDIQAS